MNQLEIFKSPVALALSDFSLRGEPVFYQQRLIKDIATIFLGMMPPARETRMLC